MEAPVTVGGRTGGNPSRRAGVLLTMAIHTLPRTLPRIALLALSATLLAACAGTPAGASSTPVAGESERPVRSGVNAEPVPSASAEPIVGEAPSDLVERIVADAAGRTGLDAGDVLVVRAEAVTWNDGSLGCPEPGGVYTQALVEGYHVIVDADGTELDYRATDNGSFRLCEEGGRPGG
jgi:hypothetical protein